MNTISSISTTKQQQKRVDAKILDRKQIQKRLQGLKPDQYEKIKNNLGKQNDKLKVQVSTLSDKVNLLLKTKNFNGVFKRNTQIQSQILNMKKQLQTRYESMNQLKEQLRKQTETNMTEQMKQKLKVDRNQIKAIQTELQQLSIEKEKLSKEVFQNQISMQDYTPNEQIMTKLQTIKNQNKQLKKKVLQKLGYLKDKQKESQQAINRIYNLKQQGFSKSRVKSLAALNKIHHKKNNSHSQTTLTEQQKLEKQIQRLKISKKQMEKQLDIDRTQRQQKKAEQQALIRERLQFQKQLFTKRVKEQSHLNYLIKKQKQNRLNQEKNLNTVIQKVDDSCQTEAVASKNYRKEWIGKSQGVPFDDYNIFQPKQLSLIKSLTIYKTPMYFVCFKVGYETSTKRKVQSSMPLQRETLRKIQKVQSKKLTSKGNGFLKGMTISLTDKLITKIQLKWSDGDISVQGWQGDESVKYEFDISENQRPASFFGTIVQQGKMFSLQSIGMQIGSI